ncbi:MAG: shikimate kinase [Phycisphaerae bacterium]|nr:shikimate kinase [Gemmatimonadaceae bacterium]
MLVGLPGAGKSTVGRKVARLLRRPFVDFDVELARREGLSIPRLFSERGESAFRQLEVALTEELVRNTPSVWAPGGGWITNPGVVGLVRPPGRIIHLRVSPAGALKRLGSARASRPLLMDSDPGVVLDRLWVSRRELYATADGEVDTEVVDFQRVALRVVLLARGLDARLG